MRGGAPLQNNGAAPPLVYCILSQNISWRCRQSNAAPVIVWGIAGRRRRSNSVLIVTLMIKPLTIHCQCNANVSSGLCHNQQMLEIILFMFFLLLLPSQFSKNTTLFQPTLALTKTVWSPCYRNSIIRRNSVQFVYYVCQPANRSNIQSSILL